jgi:exodeoxyribonuclease V beta subunit
LHSLLEQLDFQTCDQAELRQEARAALTRWGLPWSWTDELAEGVWFALHTPLSGAGEGVTLKQLSRADRRDEVSFELALGAQPLNAHLLNGVVRLDPACAQLAPFPDDFELSGYLKGSIDLLMRHPTRGPSDGLGRYMVVDYKSNWLGEGVGDEGISTLAHYHPDALERVMREHLYLLQSLLYLVALHRLLKGRLGDAYRYEEHCGGSLYVFVRGMAGEASVLPASPHTPQQVAGVFVHRPPQRVIELLDLALSDSTRALEALTEAQHYSY